MLVLGIDTLEFGLEVEDYELTFRLFLDTFKLLKESAQTKGDKPVIQIGELTLVVHGSGIPFYSYRLSCDDFIVCFADNDLGSNAPIWVKFMSSFLWSETLEGALHRFMGWLGAFGTMVTATKVSRCDICVDTDEVSFVPRDARGFVARAKGKNRHGVDDEHSEGKLFAGFTIGRGQPMLARIYHKGLEVRKSGKTWFHDVWELHGWEGNFDVWRVEFQLRRGVLKEFGVSTVEELLQKIDGLWAYCTKKWLTLCRPNGSNVSRWRLTRKWDAIQSAEFRQLTSPLVRRKVREGNLHRMLNQSAGLNVSISAALGGDSNLDTTLQVIGRWTEYRMRVKNTSFDDERNLRSVFRKWKMQSFAANLCIAPPTPTSED